ncbi:glutamine--fructose-6-phosphate transaminase (isomerizing) [Candidatus Magnetominusculus xianensis]|uniref:Glutamine--fructose-6-phosphate aminotransferase [isomerizing] n=1 Tax=Candidatus Magnetominusculus xianensis TaxID=1748249 RepID=A0ABR5SJM1_9BACT|nr:glutamine--fructose-6-phosphate transaminase (isomerizing) [Candidatus Magnetominusculus xianensis]KWT91662.1 glutamine--fructose-6-phosphate aminotransferase [Candidatus Magnetominusculus xianensis]MBF0404581.1 glutamine--fructose-6-phosphate transaminase (isomerizing) [Nitrospirota bacterium]
MCGIIGYAGKNNSIGITIEGLKKLEYRGYDSAGVAFIRGDNGLMDIVRAKGKISELINRPTLNGVMSSVAIGHTRWATHGSPSEINAHPHRVDDIAIVHNGIIENYIELKRELLKEGAVFKSETDTEVMCHLIASFYRKGRSFEDSVLEAIKLLHGSYAVNVICEKDPGKIICAKKDSPLVIGLGDGEYFCASDVPAFLSHTRDVIFMEDREMAVITREGVIIRDSEGAIVHRDPTKITWSPSMAEKGGYRHFMLKEIFEQPRAIADTITGRANLSTGTVNLYEFGLDKEIISSTRKIFIVACGTSWHAALCGKYMIEELAGIPVEIDIASEFRYRSPIIGKDDLFIAITQSGETADTLAALKEAKRHGAKTMTICNVVGSTASRESDYVFYTHSGPEIGVASTKAFLTQLVSLYLLSIALGSKGSSKTLAIDAINELLHIPTLLESVLIAEAEIEKLARQLSKSSGFLFLGRGILFPIALEGALKLKEISYIHAEGYPAGEMKHGPIALIDEGLPVVILLSKETLYEKVISNIQEVKSRGGKTVVISNEDDDGVRELSDHFILVPRANKFLDAIVMTLPLQLLAYHIAVIRGCDVDQPRNLAKSVTVE